MIKKRKYSLLNTINRFNTDIITLFLELIQMKITLPGLLIGGGTFHFFEIFGGGNSLLGPPPYSVFENFGGRGATIRTPLKHFRQKNL